MALIPLFPTKNQGIKAADSEPHPPAERNCLAFEAPMSSNTFTCLGDVRHFLYSWCVLKLNELLSDVRALSSIMLTQCTGQMPREEL